MPEPVGIADLIALASASQGEFEIVNAATAAIACFVRGTRVATPTGQVAVEHLAAGDLVSTARGGVCPVRWIGWRAYSGPFLASNPAVWPIVIREGTLADGVRQRDLRISPKHALYLDGVLVPADALVNGASVVKVPAPTEVEYYHVELDAHDVLLAEGRPPKASQAAGRATPRTRTSPYAWKFWTATCWSGAAQPTPVRRPAWPASAKLRAGTTLSACSPAWAAACPRPPKPTGRVA